MCCADDVHGLVDDAILRWNSVQRKQLPDDVQALMDERFEQLFIECSRLDAMRDQVTHHLSCPSLCKRLR